MPQYTFNCKDVGFSKRNVVAIKNVMNTVVERTVNCKKIIAFVGKRGLVGTYLDI